jgi:hypothetical protein
MVMTWMRQAVFPAMIRCLVMGVPCIQAAAAASTTEVWQGTYSCAQGVTGLTLTMNIGEAGQVQALFEFYGTSQNPSVPHGCFEMSGVLDAAGHLALAPGQWRRQPSNYVTVGLNGELSDTDGLSGTVTGPGCSRFTLNLLRPQVADNQPTACIGVVS